MKWSGSFQKAGLEEAAKAEVGNRGSLRKLGVRPRLRQGRGQARAEGEKAWGPRKDLAVPRAQHTGRARGLDGESHRPRSSSHC